jgi:Fe-S cluster biogenesis protein NfuA
MAAMDLGFRMHAERTPNPHSIKWVLGRRVIESASTAHFDEPPVPEVSPLASRLFEIDGVTLVFLASNFVTVTKREECEWQDLAQPIVDVIKDCLGEGGPALGPAFQEQTAADESDVVARIRNILEQQVRPAVAQDGGDIVFAGFRDGIVEVYLQGSCSGCPSSSITLKQGIEGLLMEAVPEVQGVVAL